MFWNDEAIESASKIAEEHLGGQGRFLTKKSAVLFVNLYTKEAGKFWYGDLDFDEDKESLVKISESVGVPVLVLPDSTLNDARPVSEQALMEISP